MLVQDATHGEANRKLFVGWAEKHGALAVAAANQLQPLWSQPRVKAVQFSEAFEQARNRPRAITAEIGVDTRRILGA